jgi:predicted transcriptional regulator
MSDKRRSTFTISRDILEACINPKSKTRVVYAANLNSLRINDYLDSLTHMGLLTRETTGTRVHYHTTPNGVKFLGSYTRTFHQKSLGQPNKHKRTDF